MKALAILVFSLCAATSLFAQKKNNVYADVYIPTIGGSVTYNHKLTKHFDMGIGVQAFDNSYKYRNVTSAVYVDVRPNWRWKKNLFFVLADIGMIKYFGDKPDPTKYTISPVGVYSALGFGYCRIVTKRGAGPFVTIAMRGGSYSQHAVDPTLPSWARDYSVFEATGMLSVGFKF